MEAFIYSVIILGSFISSLMFALFMMKPSKGIVIIPPGIICLYILFAEFVLPYQGGGASMWPLAIIFGGGFVTPT